MRSLCFLGHTISRALRMSVCFDGCCDASALVSPRDSLCVRTCIAAVHVFSTQHEKERDREMKEEQSDSLLLLRIIKSSCLYAYIRGTKRM